MRTIAILSLFVIACGSSPHFEPLVDAARAGDAARVRELVGKGADPNKPAGGNGWTPLLHAVHKHQLSSVEALLDAGADPNRAAPNGTTPLMMAAGYGATEVVALLIRRGADVKRTNADGESALDHALTGVSDVDGFTLFTCQSKTAALLQDAPVKASSERWSRIKC